MITANGYSKDPNLVPEGIVITFGKQMIKEQGGLLRFLKAFEKTMSQHEDGAYWMHTCSNQPVTEYDSIYIIVANRLYGKVYCGGYRKNASADVIGFGATGEQKLMDKPFMILAGPLEKCPYGRPGDILWVREMFFRNGDEYIYRADGTCCEQFEQCECDEVGKPKWKPSIHMPKDACRIFLKVTDIRVERLQDISPGDACDEGIEYWNIDGDALEGGELQADFKNYMWRDDEKYEDYHFPTYASCIDSFKSLWQSINGIESWEANPWVWVVSFKKIKKPGGF